MHRKTNKLSSDRLITKIKLLVHVVATDPPAKAESITSLKWKKNCWRHNHDPIICNKMSTKTWSKQTVFRIALHQRCIRLSVECGYTMLVISAVNHTGSAVVQRVVRVGDGTASCDVSAGAEGEVFLLLPEPGSGLHTQRLETCVTSWRTYRIYV